jgi:hypothetical protein
MFSGRKLLIVTKHKKEHVIIPIVEKELGVQCFVANNFDTDTLGTFTGEIERKDDPITTARNKCMKGMELSDFDMAIASEGSFGPHPTIFFARADDEFLLFVDKKNNIEIFARELTTDTNFSGATISTMEQLKEFADSVQFPTHALIVRKAKDDFREIQKGITDWENLFEAYNHFIKLHSSVYVETDMRAMYNPTRMKVIEKATKKLAGKINSLCPQCSMPGFGITNAEQGLPCNFCHFPTRSTLKFIYTCTKCNYTKEQMYPHNKQTEDPMYCDICNP